MTKPFCKTFARVCYGLLLSIAFASGALADLSDFDRDKEPLTFTVTSSKAEYDLSERIVLTLTLSLNRRSARMPAQATVETFAANTISVVSATRNGKPIEPTLGTVRYADDPVRNQVLSLAPVGPGDHVRIPFIIPGLPSQGSGLIVVQFNPESEHLALIYSLAKPGWYTLQFRYLYVGPSAGMPNVFRGELRSNPVSFLVRGVHKKAQRGTRDGLQCEVQTDPDDPEAVARCQLLLEEVRSTPAGARDLAIADSLPQTIVVRVTTEPLSQVPSGTYATVGADAFSNGEIVTDDTGRVLFQGTGNGTDSVVVINVTPGGTYSDGTPRDVGSEAVHEIGGHAITNAMGMDSSEKAPGAKKVDEDEILATQEQNIYLKQRNMDPRLEYCKGNEDGSAECVEVPPVPPEPVSPN